MQISELHEVVAKQSAQLLELQKQRHLAESKVLCLVQSLKNAEELVVTRHEEGGTSTATAVHILRTQRDQAVKTAGRLRTRLAATQFAATQHARMAAFHAGKAEACPFHQQSASRPLGIMFNCLCFRNC